MSPEEVASRYNKLPGFRIADYHSVALPLWVVTFDALVIAERKVPVVDEFILRAVQKNVNSLADLAGFLGLSEKLILRRLGSLSSGDLVCFKISESEQTSVVELTKRGEQLVRDTTLTPPRRQKLTLAYDAIARAPIGGRIARESMRTPQEIKQFGLFEIPALPSRLPDEAELSRINFNEALPKEARKDFKIHQVLSAQKVGALSRRFREGVMLIYCGVTDAEQIAVRFFSLDGRPMPEVDRGFTLNKGLQRLGIREQLKSHRESLTKELATNEDYQAVVEFAKSSGANVEDVSPSIAQAAKIGGMIEEKESQMVGFSGGGTELDRLRAEIESLKREKHEAEQKINLPQVRLIEPQEHAPIFDQALREAKKRLMVVSPWISDRIMLPKLKLLETLLARGVEVFIGFGITASEEDDPKAHLGDRTLDWLEEKTKIYHNLFVVRLGDTHAKVLLLDDRFVIVGSFNWMSFGGIDHGKGGNGRVREELSQQVTAVELLNKVYARYLRRFAHYYPELRQRGEVQQTATGVFEKIIGHADVDSGFTPKTPVQRQDKGTIQVTSKVKTKVSSPTAVARTEAKPSAAKDSAMEHELKLTPKMIAVHLGKKPYVIIATAMELKHFAKINAVLPEDITCKIYSALKQDLPTAQVAELLRKNHGANT